MSNFDHKKYEAEVNLHRGDGTAEYAAAAMRRYCKGRDGQ